MDWNIRRARGGEDARDLKTQATIDVEVSGEHEASNSGERGPWTLEQEPGRAGTWAGEKGPRSDIPLG
jgi:hypothetical protein